MNQLLLKSVFTHILHVLYRLTWAMQIQTVLSAFQETIQFALMKPFDLISVCFVGFRYRLSGLILPSLKDWFEGTFGANLQHKSPATVSPVCFIQLCTRLLCCVIVCLIHGVCVFLQPTLNLSAVAPPNLNEPFMEDLKAAGVSMSHDPEDRVFRAHGKEFCVWQKLVSFYNSLSIFQARIKILSCFTSYFTRGKFVSHWKSAYFHI